MPNSKEAVRRHLAYYLTIAEMVNDLFLEGKTQERAFEIFDRNREQIDLTLMRILEEVPATDSDIVLARFVDAVSQVGMMRYSIQGMLIPLTEHKIQAAKRLGWRELEADGLDGLGIMYAFLGYLQQATQYFEAAYQIANQVGDKELKRDIRNHLKIAHGQLRGRKISPFWEILSIARLIPLQISVLTAKIRKNPFSQVAALNALAGVYLSLENLDRSISCYQQAINISREHSYRFGELEASMGLLQAEITKDAGKGNSLSAGTVGNLVNDFGFEWRTDFSVFETLLGIAPAIKNAEMIAGQFAAQSDPRAEEIYGLLDGIMRETSQIVSAAGSTTAAKDEIFVASLRIIRDDLAHITAICSRTIDVKE